MRIYCVQILGEPFLLAGDGTEVESGFYRNEFVLTSSEDKAIAIAKTRTMKKLALKSVKMIEARPIKLTIENVKTGAPMSSLLYSQGFCFFPVDS